MKVYKNTYLSHQDSSVGFAYFSNRKEAEKEFNKFKKRAQNLKDFDGTKFDDFNPDSRIECLEIPITAKGIINALNYHASHNDNG